MKLSHIAIVFVAAALPLPLDGQEVPPHTRVVLGAGVSFAGAGPASRSGPGLAGHVGLRHQRGHYVFSARAGMNGGGSSPIRVPGGGLRDRFDELAILGGYAVHRGEDSQVVLSAGLAAVSGERVETDSEGSAATVPFNAQIGLPVQLALSAPGASSGLGLVVHLNLNPEEVFGAVTATYLIGRN